jgi:hypothetical protein
MGDRSGSTATPADRGAVAVRSALRSCERCGEPLPGGARFCPRCGEHAAPAPSAPPVAPTGGRSRRRLILAGLAALLLAGAAAGAVAMLGGDSGSPPARSPVSRAEAQDVVDRYAAAHSAENLAALDLLLTPSFRKRTPTGVLSRPQALADYARQFARLSEVVYGVATESMTTRRGGASVAARYRITTAQETATGLIRFELVRRGDEVLVSRITTIPTGGSQVDATPAPTPTPAPDAGDQETTTGGQAAPAFARTARVKTWWNGEFVHFKAVDEATGRTVEEALGSDDADLPAEIAALRETPERRALVDELRAQMRAAGWTEIGRADGGEWYELRFGR